MVPPRDKEKFDCLLDVFGHPNHYRRSISFVLCRNKKRVGWLVRESDRANTVPLGLHLCTLAIQSVHMDDKQVWAVRLAPSWLLGGDCASFTDSSCIIVRSGIRCQLLFHSVPVSVDGDHKSVSVGLLFVHNGYGQQDSPSRHEINDERNRWQWRGYVQSCCTSTCGFVDVTLAIGGSCWRNFSELAGGTMDCLRRNRSVGLANAALCQVL
mmetsp:Transcript_9868/g.23083  ORF Transcript_9868/g.23083 Transcript_9868/m.23083 type:complete len:211 (-) Transcript_9868:68-700(-)